jgi:general secretion pathway protein A
VQPPAPLAQDEPLYESFYGLREQPFALSTDPRFLFMSASHRRAYDDLLTGLRRREGLMLLTGETGTGKTTMCRAVVDALGHRTFSALILNPYMSDAEVLRVILRDFGLVSRNEIRRGALAKADTPQLLDTLESFLRSLLPLNSYAVLIIDEAQSLAPAVLDQIRVLGSYEQDGVRLLQIMLVGQPSLSATVLTESLQALNDRITRRVGLEPLTPAELADYIRHRLDMAGGRDRVAFLPGAVTLINDLSQGLPRRVNLICDRALEEGRVAGATQIDADMVRRAARSIAGTEAGVLPSRQEVGLDPEIDQAERPEREMTLMLGQRWARSRTSGLVLGISILLIAAVVAAGAYFWTKRPDLPPSPVAPRIDIGRPPPTPVPGEGRK